MDDDKVALLPPRDVEAGEWDSPPPSPVVAHFRRGRRPLLLASFLISTFVLALSACWPLSNVLTHRTPVDALDLPVVELPLPIELRDDSRFLVLTVIGEQESRAQYHLIQLARLANTLNRTLVLPRISYSRFNSCGKQSFDFIYDVPTFAERNEVRPVEQRDFEDWLASQAQAVSARAVRLCENAPGELDRWIPDPAYNDHQPTQCLEESKLDHGVREPLRYCTRGLAGVQRVPSELQQLDAEDPVAVLLMYYDLRSPMLGEMTDDDLSESFDNEQSWHDIVSAVLDLMGPAIGVHWRTERISAAALEPCGSGLVDALVAIRDQTPDLSAVYLATDYPIELLSRSPSRLDDAKKDPEGPTFDLPEGRPRAHSDTLTRLLTPAHHLAMSHFLSSFHSLATPAGLNLSTYHSLLPHLPAHLSRWSTQDSAPAIVSQLVLRQTELFLAGEPNHKGGEQLRPACARDSTWTSRVVRARRKTLLAAAEEGGVVDVGEGERTLRNLVVRWSTDGQAI
ncbi:uncharacterized protein JCM10292_003413 [Rhodotorula paludigena]|uniref:uncharacterized protein n=1 Tax=Rhodotorula paludigena TaxID=86838 RepID=UPI0031772C85